MENNNINKEILKGIDISKKMFESIFSIELLPVVDKYTKNFYPDIQTSNCLTDFKTISNNTVYVCFYPVLGVKNGFCLVDVTNLSQPKILLKLQKENNPLDWFDLIKDKDIEGKIKRILAI